MSCTYNTSVSKHLHACIVKSWSTHFLLTLACHACINELAWYPKVKMQIWLPRGGAINTYRSHVTTFPYIFLRTGCPSHKHLSSHRANSNCPHLINSRHQAALCGRAKRNGKMRRKHFKEWLTPTVRLSSVWAMETQQGMGWRRRH